MILRRVTVLFAAFVLLGLPEGLLGTAWPSMRASFERPESALAQLLVTYTVGYLVATVGMGRLVDRLGSDRMTRAGLAMTALGLAGYGVSPIWALALCSAFTVGAGAGVVDASVNAEVAVRHGQRTMNLLHGCFGIGAMLGPILVTGLLSANIGWRYAFVILVVAELCVLVLLSRSTDSATEPGNDGDSSTRYAPLVARPRLVLAVSLIYFAIYVAGEVSIGQWTYSVMTEARGVSETAAGFAVAAYWGGLTLGRILLGAIGDRLHPLRLLQMSGPIACAAMAWFLFELPGSPVALSLVGLAFAGTFPALVLLTSSWLPEGLIVRAVGYQLAASSAGAIIAAIVFGTLAAGPGLEATVPAMFVLTCALVVVNTVISRVSADALGDQSAITTPS